MAEFRREMELGKLRKQKKKVPTEKSFCLMCDLDVHGTLNYHRNSMLHKRLKAFLHPKCQQCRQEFTSRSDWDEHLLSLEHLENKAAVLKEKGEEAADNMEKVTKFDTFACIKIEKTKKKNMSIKNKKQYLINKIDLKSILKQEQLTKTLFDALYTLGGGCL